MTAVALNGEVVNLTASNSYEQTFQNSEVNVVVHKYRQMIGQTVHLTTRLYNILIYASPRQWDEKFQEVTR